MHNNESINEWSIFYFFAGLKKNKIMRTVHDNNAVKILSESLQKSLVASVLFEKVTFEVEVKKKPIL